jgi:uncharacterized protein Smg (DUF494 family)
MTEKLKNMGETLTPFLAGKRGYLELVTFEIMADRLYKLYENPIDPDDFPLVFQTTKWNIYGTENLRTQMQDLGLINIHEIDTSNLFDKNFQIETFRKIRQSNSPEKTK